MGLSGSAQMCDQENNTLGFMTKEGDKQLEDFFFSPGSQFPKEMRPILLSCLLRERPDGHTMVSICHVFEEKSGSMGAKSEDANRQRHTFPPLQLRTYGTEPEGMEPTLAETCRFQK